MQILMARTYWGIMAFDWNWILWKYNLFDKCFVAAIWGGKYNLWMLFWVFDLIEMLVRFVFVISKYFGVIWARKMSWKRKVHFEFEELIEFVDKTIKNHLNYDLISSKFCMFNYASLPNPQTLRNQGLTLIPPSVIKVHPSNTP